MLESESVSFSAEASGDQDGYIVSYLWDFGDGDTNGREPGKNTCWQSFRYYDFNILKSPGNCHGRGKSAVFGEQHND